MKKMMIVDDSMVIRRKIERCAILNEDLHIVSAADGAEAIEVFEREMPDIVTMDLTMPKIDGVECVKYLMTMKPEVHILVVSALKDKATAIEAIKNGAEGFLSKPFSDEALTEALHELLSTEASA